MHIHAVYRDEFYLRQVFVLLFLCAVSVDLINAEIGMRAITERNSSRRSTQFLENNHVIEIRASCTTVLRLHRDAQEAQFPQLPPECLHLYNFYIKIVGFDFYNRIFTNSFTIIFINSIYIKFNLRVLQFARII